MADPLYVLKEKTEGIFEIWSTIENIHENVEILDTFLR
jgi:hypothetical protein